MKFRLLLSFISISFIGFNQISTSLDIRSDSIYEIFMSDFHAYCNDTNNQRAHKSVTECELRVAHNRLMNEGYRQAWTVTSRHSYTTIVQGKIVFDSLNPIELCDSIDSSSEIFFLFHGMGSFTTIGDKYVMVGSSLPTGSLNDVSYYYIREN